MSSREDILRFSALGLSCGALGLEEGDAASFCTPEGAETVGSLGCGGVHFVLLPGDERVFCVDPMAGEGSFVLPVAGNFRDFLSYILYCRNANPLSQIYQMDGPAFWSFLEEDLRQSEGSGDASLSAIAEAFGLEPREPFEEVKALQAAFDPAGLSFSDAYYEILGLENPRGVSAPESHRSFESTCVFSIRRGGEPS